MHFAIIFGQLQIVGDLADYAGGLRAGIELNREIQRGTGGNFRQRHTGAG